jgi:hypothetical protein
MFTVAEVAVGGRASKRCCAILADVGLVVRTWSLFATSPACLRTPTNFKRSSMSTDIGSRSVGTTWIISANSGWGTVGAQHVGRSLRWDSVTPGEDWPCGAALSRRAPSIGLPPLSDRSFDRNEQHRATLQHHLPNAACPRRATS